MAQVIGKGRKRRIIEVEGALALNDDDKKELEDIKAGRKAGDWRKIIHPSFAKYPEFKDHKFEELFFNGQRTYWCRCGALECSHDHTDMWFCNFNNTRYYKLEFRNHLNKSHNTSPVSIAKTLAGKVQFKKARIIEIRNALARFIATTRSPLQMYESSAFVEAMLVLLSPWQINRKTIEAFSPSRRTVVRSLETQADDIRELIFDKSLKLIENSGPAVLVDHHSSKGYQESTKKLGVALSFYDQALDRRNVIMLGYREVQNSTVATNKEKLEQILMEFDLAVPVASGIIPLVSDFAKDAVGLTRSMSPLNYQCATHSFSKLLQRGLTMCFPPGSILLQEWKLLEALIKGAKTVLEARQCPPGGERCLNTFLQQLKLDPLDIERYSRLQVLSQHSSLGMTAEQLEKEVADKTEAVRAECSTPDGKTCPIFVKLCDTRFRRFAENIRTVLSVQSRLRPLENRDNRHHYLLNGAKLPSEEFLSALGVISTRLEAMMNLYDSETEITGRSIVSDYGELLAFLVRDLNKCSLLEAALRRHFIQITTEQMFPRYLSADGEIITKAGTGVPTRIQDIHLAVEYLHYPRSQLDYYFIVEKISMEPSDYTYELVRLIKEETAGWKTKAVLFLNLINELQTQNEEVELHEPPIENLSLSLHPSLQQRSGANIEQENLPDSFAIELEKYGRMTPDLWFEVIDPAKSDATNSRLFWESPAARRVFPTLCSFATKLLRSCCPSSSGLERLFSRLAGLKRKDRKRLKASTQEKICIAGTSTASICYVKKL